MALELVYTSAARGLRPGGGGFCTVAMTVGMPPSLVPRLEALSGYRPAPSGASPVAHCFWRVETAAGTMPVLSVVSAAPPDHTARTNKIAAYLVLSPEELVPAGPAWLVSRPGLLRRSWSGDPAWIEKPVAVPRDGDAGMRRCAAWERACGDAGWAGVVASTFLRDQSWPIHVVYGPRTEPLELVDEVIRLLPAWARWRATFSTYFLQTVAGIPCALRFCLDGTSGADVARNSKGLLVDLTRPLEAAPDSRFARMARTGVDEPERQPAGAAPRADEGSLDLEELQDPAPGAQGDLRRTGTRRERADARRGGRTSSARRPSTAVLAAAMGAVTLLLVVFVAVVVLMLRGRGSPPLEQAPVGQVPVADAPPVVPAPPVESPAPRPPAAPVAPAKIETAPIPARTSADPPAPAPPTPPPAAPTPLPAAEPAPSVPRKSIPANAFERTVDDRSFVEPRSRAIFESGRPIASAAADIGEVDGIVARESGSAIEFRDAGEGIALGELSWSGGTLSWSWRRVGTRSLGKSVDALAGALALGEIEVRHADGTTTLLAGPVPVKQVRLALGEEATAAIALPKGTVPSVVILISSPWRKAAPGAGPARCESDAGTVSAWWDPDGGGCRVSWGCPEVVQLQATRKTLAAREAEAKDRPENEREFVLQEVAELRDAVEDLARAVARRQESVPSVPPIEVRGRAGRVLAKVQVTLTPRKSQ